jgi:exfoliative toxin A/B
LFDKLESRRKIMLNMIKNNCDKIPTAASGLALGIASIALLWDHVVKSNGYIQISGALIALCILLAAIIKFKHNPKTLINDLQHPVLGSIVPTFSMTMMVISKMLAQHVNMLMGQIIWCIAVLLHFIFLILFVYYRAKDFKLHHMIPSWFVPPVGIVVAAVTLPSNNFLIIASGIVTLGIMLYSMMLPTMVYRLIFQKEIEDTSKPTIAIMAAPASLCLAGYLSTASSPSPIIVAVLLGIAILMTVVIYCSFIKLLRLPFSPGYAAFTFPMVIGATALFKVCDFMVAMKIPSYYINQVQILAYIEIMIASLIVIYVAAHYCVFFTRRNIVLKRDK